MLGSNGTYYSIPSQAIADAYGINTIFKGYVNYTDSSFLANMTNKGPLPWIARFNDNPIYLASPQGLHHFLNETDYNKFGYQFGSEANLPAYLKNYYSTSTDIAPTVMLTDWSAIYSIDLGKKSQIANLTAYNTLGTPTYSSRPSVVLPPQYVATLTDSAPIIANGTFTRTSDTNQLGVYSNDKLYTLDGITAGYWGSTPDYVSTSTRLAMVAQAGSSLSAQYASDASGTQYLLGNKRKITFSPNQAIAYGLTGKTFTQVNQDILDRFTTQTAGNIVRSVGDAAVYHPIAGKLYHIYSPEDLSGLGFVSGDTMVINNPIANLFTNSSSKEFAAGRLIRIDGTPQVYVIDDNLTMHFIPSEDNFYSFNYSFNNVTVAPAGSLTGYTSAGDLNHYVSEYSGTKWIIDNRQRYKLDSSTANAFGYTNGQFPVVSSRVIYPTALGPNMTQLIRANNSPVVYYISGGQRHWVSSESLFYTKGFSWAQVRVLSPDIVATIPLGADLQ
ncbi:hypothetical protein H7Y29_00370 [Microbacteriaceae bacterium]|nr:hypothetical protein [Candidatus Saccharibacteria bacterium]